MPHRKLATIPTPMAGLALGIGSLGWCWENMGSFHGTAQTTGAVIAGAMLIILALKFLTQPRLLLDDLAHPVVGSVVPTFAMGTMVVSKAIQAPWGSSAVWLCAVVLHLTFLSVFVWHRSRNFQLSHMVPSWFVPPVGIIVAAVCSPGGAYAPLAEGLMWFGMVCYAIMLPIMLYRLTFCDEVPDGAKPTIAIMAAPASLTLAGYLTVIANPSPLIVSVLLGIALLMTLFIYVAFGKLLRLPFSPGYAAFTFPLVIGATALFKSTAVFNVFAPHEALHLRTFAEVELIVATVIVSYVALRYALHFLPRRQVATQSA